LDYGVSAAITNLAEVYRMQGKIEEAKTTILDALERYKKRGDKGRIAISLFSLGEIETEQKKYSKAIQYYQEALDIAEQIGRKESIKDANDRLNKLYLQTVQYEKSYEYLQAYIAVKDSIFDEKTTAQYQELQTQYETEQKNQEIEWLQQKQAIDKRIQYGLIGISLIFLILAVIIYLALHTARRSNASLLQEQRSNQKLLQEKEELLQRLEKTKQQLIQNEKMASIGQLTAGVAHEINNPISFISTNILALKMDYLEIKGLISKINELEVKKVKEADIEDLINSSKQLDTKYLSSEIDQLIAGIERGVKRTRDIVKSLSVFSRNTEEKFQKADLNDGIRSTLMLVKTNIPRDIEVETELGELPLVECQISPLNQVFMNIIGNAAQAIEDAGTIRIRTWQAGEFVHIAISDTGKGISDKIKNKIFDPFFTTKKVGEGTGLGLSISYGIIETHQGSIQMKSAEHKGSTFEIKLPIKQD
ncbi:MAG: ATP-binding protein, partial [Bacteroidota bacterium]